MRSEVMKRYHTRYDGRQCFRYARITCVGDVTRAIHLQTVDFSVECPRNLLRRSGKIDQGAARINRIYLQAVGLEPAGDSFNVLLGCSEEFAELGRCQPCMVVRGTRVLLLIEK